MVAVLTDEIGISPSLDQDAVVWYESLTRAGSLSTRPLSVCTQRSVHDNLMVTGSNDGDHVYSRLPADVSGVTMTAASSMGH